MKIQANHYEQLKGKMLAFLQANPQIDTTVLVSRRQRWDLYWACGGAFTNEQQYLYLNDDHIETAIKSIIREYEVAQ